MFSCSICPTLCGPMDYSPPGSSVHGIFQERYWSGLPFPTPGDLPNPGIKPTSPALAGGFFYQESHLGSPIWWPLRRSFPPQTTWENSPGICVTSRIQDRFSREQDDLRGCVGWWVLKALLQSVHLIQRSTGHHQQDWTGRRAWPGVWKARMSGQEERFWRWGENSRMQKIGALGWSKWKWKLLSHVWLLETPWTEFSRPEYWSR